MLTVTQSSILFFYPPQILIILEEVEQLALGGVVRSTHNTTQCAMTCWDTEQVTLLSLYKCKGILRFGNHGIGRKESCVGNEVRAME
jgi:hypothetical protein